ncbi:MAG: hypothetical protein BWK78_01830 [Thiotrichaceae bacterium IS1]|nr:MAG: hypothetical protein BWK78_01830 [Thiotrichaceae bacterium IS1]
MTMTILRNTLKILAVCIPASGILSCAVPPTSTPDDQTSGVAEGPTRDEIVTALGGGNQQEVKPVQFAVGGTKISKEEAKSLERFISEYNNQGREISLKITGHADSKSIGGEAANQSISEDRANAVKEFLASHGIPRERMTATGVGSRDLLCRDTEVSAWQRDCCEKLNRRVEIEEELP